MGNDVREIIYPLTWGMLPAGDGDEWKAGGEGKRGILGEEEELRGR